MKPQLFRLGSRRRDLRRAVRTLSLAVLALGLLSLGLVAPHLRPLAAQEKTTASGADSPARVDSNQIYGMYSGLALLMDVYHPRLPNGYGVILIPGAGWLAPLTYSAGPLKNETHQVLLFVPPLVKAGYVVFVINHRAAPRFRYPAAVEDAQRAVRFIRHNARIYGADSTRLGGVGYSSGAHLVSLLGTLEGKGDPDDPDPINRESAKLQCVVAGATPADLTNPRTPIGAGYVTTFLGMPTFPDDLPTSESYKKYREASPLYHVSAASAPELLFHGTADTLAEIDQAERLAAALEKAGVPNKLVRIPGGTHYQLFVKDGPDFLAEMVHWFDQYLRVAPPSR
jgi:acetyl esterase/lipase